MYFHTYSPSFMCACGVLLALTHVKITPQRMPTVSQVPRRRTHRDWNEQGLHTCTPTASMFVCFFLKVHHPPLESSESHAGGAALKVCHRGRLRGPARDLQSPRRVPRRTSGPVQWSGSAEEKAGAHWKHAVRQRAALKPHGSCFTQGGVLELFRGQPGLSAVHLSSSSSLLFLLGTEPVWSLTSEG